MLRGTGSPGKPSGGAAKAAAIAAAEAAIHSVVAGKPPARKAASRRPATSIVTEHTRGQANGGAARPAYLPADYGQSNRRGLTQANRPAAQRHATDYEYAHPHDPAAAAAKLLDTLAGSPVESVNELVRHPVRSLSAPKPVYLREGRRGGWNSGQLAPMDEQPLSIQQVPYGPVKGGGLLGLGRKVTEDAAAPAAAASTGVDATKAAIAHAEQHSVPIAEVKGTGAAGRILRGDVERHRFQALPLSRQVQQATKGARSAYGVEKAGRGEDFKVRAAAVDRALRTIADPHEAMAAASAAMRGEYAQIDFHGFKNLTPEALKALMVHVNNLDTLQPLQKLTLNKAMNRAFEDNRVPRPHEMRLIDHVFGKQTAMGFAQHAGGKWGDKVINALNIPRSLESTLDFSAVGRQTIVAGASHPVMWSRNIPDMVKAAKSQAHYDTRMEQIKSDPAYTGALEAGISFTDIGDHVPIGKHEEQFSSDYAANALDHIPGVPNVIKGSARAYTLFTNQMRLDLYKHQLRMRIAAGKSVTDEKFQRQIGQVINAATGRGTLPGRAEHLLPAMNTFMFSPRLMLARLHYLDPSWYIRLKGPARREALRGLFATAGAVTSALYTFSRIPGVTVGSLDPRSSDFGKLKVGNTRVDLAGGFQQYVRLAAELATQTSVSSTTGQKQKLGSGFGVPTSLDVIQNFAYNKLAPAPGMAVNVLRGHDAVGNPVVLPGRGKKTLGVPFGTILPNNFTPLVLQDAKDIYNEKHGGMDGIAAALGGYAIGAAGFGLQTYGPKKPSTSKYEKELKQVGLQETPDVKALFTLAAERAANRAGQPKTVHGRLVADLQTLRQAGRIDAKTQAETLAQAQGMSEYALSQALQKAGFNKNFDPTGALSRLDRAAARKRGGG